MAAVPKGIKKIMDKGTYMNTTIVLIIRVIIYYSDLRNYLKMAQGKPLTAVGGVAFIYARSDVAFSESTPIPP